MSASVSQRIRRLARDTSRYLKGWRGLLILIAAVSSAVVVGIAASSVPVAVAAFGAASIPLVIVGLLMANQESRTQKLVSQMRDSVAASVDVELAPAHEGSQRAPSPVPPEPGATQKPLVAVIVTAWNESRFISAAIESILSQSVQSFECIVVDDASTDDTLEKVLRMVGHDSRFRVLRHESNQGLAAARNAGLAAVQAPYVTFLDGDDCLYPESLEKRLSEMVVHRDKPWIAGVYCQWSNVPERAVPDVSPTPAGKRRTVTWLNSLTDAPFIATAPMLRTEVARLVGGFPDANTAEDTLFWNRVLREGYIFTPVHHVGVAYRMKRTSMFRRTAVEHANLIADALALNGKPTGELRGSGPYAFDEAAVAYLWDVTRMKRMVGALANAVELADDQAAAETAHAVNESLRAYHLWELPLEAVIRSQASRVSRHVAEAEFAVHRELVANEMKRLLEDRTVELIDEVKNSQAALIRRDEYGTDARDIRLEPRRRLSVPPALLARSESIVDGRIILMPAAAYHIDETGPLSVELNRLGVDSVVMVSDRRWPSIEWAQAAYRTPVVESVAAGPWLERAAGVVVMNDWGEEYKEYVETANELEVPTFAKIEGVQDFNDDDVHWERKAYQRVRWILAQGPNDVRALPTKDSIVVSNNRLERIWLDPQRSRVSPLVVVNLNFTYGVLEGARDMWMASIAEACETAELPFVVSLHPAERDRWSGAYPIADVPMRHLLTKASVLVSRFSTVPFEAMARGVPFVYHNPHAEKVPTFQESEGAFEITRSGSELAAALTESLRWQENYRERSEAFFLNQVAVDEAVPAPRRAAIAIAERIRTA